MACKREREREKRVKIGRNLLNSMKRNTRKKIGIFSDEKLFITDQKKANRRNDRYRVTQKKRSSPKVE